MSTLSQPDETSGVPARINEGATSRRTIGRPQGWARLRQQTLERDGGQCCIVTNGDRCQVPATDVHHTNGAADDNPDHLISICASHHRVITARDAARERWNRPRAHRDPETHPGVTP